MGSVNNIPVCQIECTHICTVYKYVCTTGAHNKFMLEVSSDVIPLISLTLDWVCYRVTVKRFLIGHTVPIFL